MRPLPETQVNFGSRAATLLTIAAVAACPISSSKPEPPKQCSNCKHRFSGEEFLGALKRGWPVCNCGSPRKKSLHRAAKCAKNSHKRSPIPLMWASPQGDWEERHQAMIPDSHPLQELFTELIHHHFDRDIGLRDDTVQTYVAGLLTEFCECQQLYKIQTANGRALHDVGEMLLEADPVYGPAPSFDRERQVRKHIGDYTLFLSGMFPESINRFRLRRARLENFVDFMKAGKESYFIVSKFDQLEYAKIAPLFAKLAHEFESCVYGLSLVKGDLQEMQHPITRQANDLIM